MKRITCGLIGAHIANSRFGDALAMLGAEQGVAVAFRKIDTGDDHEFPFEERVRSLIRSGWTGLTVTHPFKRQAMAMADRRFGLPERLRAANTLLFDDGVAATNTDYTGLRGAWAEIMGAERPGRVGMAGAGGAARAIGAALSEAGATEIAVWDLTPGAAEALAVEAGGVVRAVSVEEAPALIAAADGLVNATPLGMAAHPGSAFEAAALGPQGWMLDAVYGPAPTRFACDAAAAGLTSITGHDLFRHMMLGSFKAYTGIDLDPAAALPKLKALTGG
ncbi:MAG: hypothetical protein WD969_15965 [Paracoccaceae bacterium]